MDILTTSLDALLMRATNPQNENVDKAAVEAFCALINKENEGSHIAVRLLANKIHAQNEKEALQALGVLDSCMKKCGSSFTSEVGKFRFLNEMIKLVSPKYLGSQTAPLVRVKVLQLLQCWTEDFPKETKIKEAYDMLKKQGVVVEVNSTQKTQENQTNRTPKTNSIFDNDDRSRLLQKLLQSKNPDDLQAANRLIKTMVKEDDKRAELVSRRVVELEAVHNNVRLLNEMLDSYRPGQSSTDELDLIKELHQSCERLRPNVYRLAAETQQNEDMLKEVLHASDELSKVFDKYTAIIIKGVVPFRKVSEEESLLDLGSPNSSQTSLMDSTSPDHLLNSSKTNTVEKKLQSDIDALCDIFSSTMLPAPMSPIDTIMLKPTPLQTTVLQVGNDSVTGETEKSKNKMKAFEDLDVLGETLLKENLSSVAAIKTIPNFNKTNEKIPMNQLPKPESQSAISTKNDPLSSLDLSFLTGEKVKSEPQNLSQNGDDKMVDLTNDHTDTNLLTNNIEINSNQTKEEDKILKENKEKIIETTVNSNKLEIKPMNDIHVKLESIKPSSIQPLTVLEEKNGISVTLHFAKDKPREDVQVIVITTISKNSLPLTNYLFQGVVPKTCKLKLQPPSGTELPAHNPFLPPSAITQIMLVANPTNAKVSLKFMLSYTMDDDMCTEMGEVDSLPSV